MKTRVLYSLFVAAIAIILKSCANQGYPEGGPKDVEPPKIANSEPALGGKNYKGKDVTIQFDELIKLDGMDAKFVSSPPLKNRPTISARGKSLVIKFDEELQENATYTLDFADAIQDNNENNKLENFRFHFSTGLETDSLTISGFVNGAKQLEPIEGCMVLLYKNLADSAFKTEVPLRIAKTDAKGRFSIHNIGYGTYRIFALNDANRNYLFDQPSEEIAWDTITFSPSFEYRMVKDSTLLNKIAKSDSIKLDTLSLYTKKLFYLPDSLQLFMYQQDYEQQYLKGDARKERTKIDLIFAKPVLKGFDICLKSDSTRSLESWAIKQTSLNKDSITIWITDTLISNQDSLAFSLKYQIIDSLNNPIIKNDSLISYFFKIETAKKKLKKGEVAPKPTLQFSGMPSSIDVFANYPIQLNAPPVSIKREGIKLLERRDTTDIEVPFELLNDSTNATRLFIKKKWEYDVAYTISIDSATFHNSYGITNNAVKKKLSIKPENTYGLLLVTLENSEPNALVQLVDKNDNVVRQQYRPKNGKMAFSLVNPGDYFIKIVYDTNRNKRYDIGDYQKGILPEKVIYYPEMMIIRANWRHDIKWDASKFNVQKFANTYRKPIAKKK